MRGADSPVSVPPESPPSGSGAPAGGAGQPHLATAAGSAGPPPVWYGQRLNIGARLTLSFVALAVLMVLGGAVAFWQFHVVRTHTERLHQADMKAQTVLRVHARVLTFRQDLESLLETGDAERFRARVEPLRAAFVRDVDQAIQALSASPSDFEVHEPMVRTLETVRLELPAQLDGTVEMARAGDWPAVRRRLDRNVTVFGQMTGSLVQDIDAEVGREQALTVESIQRVHRRALWTLSLTGLLALLMAALLGVAVTRSITGPLAQLDAGAQSLARGEFQHQVAVAGGDELANLGRVFNQTTSRLQDVYAALRQSEQHFRSLIDNASDLITVVSGEGKILYCSPSSRRVVGYEPADVVGKDLFHFVRSPHSAARLRSVLARRVASLGAGTPFEIPFRHADGSTRILEAVANNRIADPAVGGIVVNCRDVTDRREAEKARRASEERYRALYEDTPSMYFTVDTEGTVISVNRFGAAYLGYTPGELVSGSVLEVFPEEERAAATAHVAKCLTHPEQVFVWEIRKVRKDRSLLWVKETARAVRGKDGRLAVLIVCEDITETKRAEEVEIRLRGALEKAAVEWEMTFDSIDTPILILDGGGRIAQFNRAARDAAGRTDWQDMLGRPVADMGAGQPWQKAAELAGFTARTRSSSHSQVRDDASGRTWDVTAGPTSGPPTDEDRVIVVARDITQLIELQDSLRRSETMSAMGSLVAGVAHEVRNPLFGISANLDAFEVRCGDRSEYKEMLTMLRGEADRLVALMNDLLEYGRPVYERPAPEPLEEVAAQAVQACAELARQGKVSILNKIVGSFSPVVMDRMRIAQVLQNLLDNAIRHSPAEGTVVLEATELVGKDGGAWVSCSVKDSGPGFRDADLPRIFEPFFSRRRGGTGLGLSIVQRIVHLHGGTIKATNRPEGGAAMTLRLPRGGPAAGPGGTRVSREP